MPLCRTKSGTLRVYSEGQEYLLTPEGLELPDELAADIRPHANVVVEERTKPPAPAEPPRRAAKSRGDGPAAA